MTTQLPWWDWSLIAIGCWLLAFVVLLPWRKNPRLFACLGVPLASIPGLAGFVAAATAVIRFVRWAWGP